MGHSNGRTDLVPSQLRHEDRIGWSGCPNGHYRLMIRWIDHQEGTLYRVGGAETGISALLRTDHHRTGFPGEGQHGTVDLRGPTDQCIGDR